MGVWNFQGQAATSMHECKKPFLEAPAGLQLRNSELFGIGKVVFEVPASEPDDLILNFSKWNFGFGRAYPKSK